MSSCSICLALSFNITEEDRGRDSGAREKSLQGFPPCHEIGINSLCWTSNQIAVLTVVLIYTNKMPFICQAKYISRDKHLLFSICTHADAIWVSTHAALTSETMTALDLNRRPKNTSQKYSAPLGAPVSDAERMFSLVAGRTTLGSEGTDIPLQGPGVAAQHCYIENHAGSITLFPCGNQCSVDGLHISKPYRLTQGTKLTTAICLLVLQTVMEALSVTFKLNAKSAQMLFNFTIANTVRVLPVTCIKKAITVPPPSVPSLWDTSQQLHHNVI